MGVIYNQEVMSSHPQVAEPKELFTCMQRLIHEKGLGLSEVLPLFTSNPAQRLKLPHKGQVRLMTSRYACVLVPCPLNLENLMEVTWCYRLA